MDWGIPSLRSDRLASLVPERVYTGGPVVDPAHTLFVWRTGRFLAEARGGVLGFHVDDYRFECLWRQPERYAEKFAGFGWGAVIEPDFSTWANAPLAEQLWSIYRMRSLGRLYQEHGLALIPNLAWSDKRSYEFCFQGIPRECPVAACEARTAGGNDDDRRAFLAGLSEGIRQVVPQTVLVYGGQEHDFWLRRRLPEGPRYVLLESWTRVRGKVRQYEEQRLRHRNQFTFNFPTKGTDTWADEAQVAAALVAEPA